MSMNKLGAAQEVWMLELLQKWLVIIVNKKNYNNQHFFRMLKTIEMQMLKLVLSCAMLRFSAVQRREE